MSETFEAMRAVYLERIHVVKCCIELELSNQRPIHLMPYGARPKARAFKNKEIEPMLADKVLETAQTEWAAPIFFAPKEDALLRFCVEC